MIKGINCGTLCRTLIPVVQTIKTFLISIIWCMLAALSTRFYHQLQRQETYLDSEKMTGKCNSDSQILRNFPGGTRFTQGNYILA